MKVSLLVIGSEVLSGKVSDANTKLLAGYLLSNNIDFVSVMIVRDDPQEIIRGLEELKNNSEVIITSGGLGPTKDDMTKSTIGSYLGRKSVYNNEAETIARRHYERLQRQWPGKDHEYAQLPEGFIALSNSSGFAPAFYVEHENKIILSAPGVPREFQSVIEDHLLKITSGKREISAILNLITVRTKKVPEEKIFGEVDPQLWDKLSQYGDVSSLPTLMGVDICVKTRSTSLAESQLKAENILKTFKASPIHPSVWNYGAESLEEVILLKAKEKNVTFGFAESATGGLCSHRITEISGSSQSFLGSVICYDESVKKNFLGVDPKTLDTFGVVSPETAQEMAKGLLNKLNVNIAISITGIAGPTGSTTDNPVGTVCIGVATKNKVTAESFKLLGNRELLKIRFSQVALLTLLEQLDELL